MGLNISKSTPIALATKNANDIDILLSYNDIDL